MSTENLFTKTKERSGSINLNRTDYQRNWSLWHLLELHSSGNDYAIVFEHDEDVITFDKEINFEKINFYQIKTRDGGGKWTLKELLTKNKSKSFLSKLYENKIKYTDKTGSLNFVSNEKFSVDLKDLTDSTHCSVVCFDKFSDKNIKKLKSTVSKDLKRKEEEIAEEIFFFRFSDLALHDSSTHTKGKVMEFLQKTFKGKKIDAEIVYNTLFDEIRIKSAYEHTSNNLDELLKNKGITKSYFKFNILDTLIKKDLSNALEESWQIARGIMLQSSVSGIEVLKIKKAWDDYEITKMDGSNDVIRELKKNIIKIINDKSLTNNPEKNLTNFLDEVVGRFFISDFGKDNKELYNEQYIKAVSLREYYERELSSSLKKSD